MQTLTIAVAGKGGMGKTTAAGLIVEALRRRGVSPILAVDADPNSTLGDVLGMQPACTVSDVLERTRGMRDIPDGLSKPAMVEMQLSQCVTESKGFDLLVMGHPEGPQCYCSANNVLRDSMSRLSSNYRAVVLDNEAGMEHFNRRVSGAVDVLLIVSDPSALGLRTARRLAELVGRMQFLKIGAKFLLLNRVRPGETPDEGLVAATGLKVVARIPDEPELGKLSLECKPLAGLSADSQAFAAVEAMVKRLTGTQN